MGDVMRVETSGASEQTAGYDRLSERGVAASCKMAQTDFSRVKKYKGIIETVAKEKNIQRALIAGIMSRESRAGAGLKDGWGDHDNAFGLMQVDKRWHAIKGGWASKEHISQATGILVDMIKSMQRTFPHWTKEQQLKGGIAAYNCGPSRVTSYDTVDRGTTGHDYSNDVVARAQWYNKHW